jgi:hypothetical protein
LPTRTSAALRCYERRRPQINAIGHQQVKGHVSRAAATEQQLVRDDDRRDVITL